MTMRSKQTNIVLRFIILCVYILAFHAGKVFSVEPIFKDDKEIKLKKSPSGLYWAYNRGYANIWDMINTSLESWVKLDGKRAKPFQDACQAKAFSYIDSYYGAHVSLEANETKEVIRVLDRKFTDPFDDKGRFQEIARHAGIEGEIVPRAWATKEEALAAISPGEVDILFIKDPTSTRGRGIDIISTEELRTYDVPRGHVIQEGVTRNLALINGSRIAARLYLVIMHGRLFCYHRGFVQEVNAKFDPLSTSVKVHVSHSDYTQKMVEMRLPRRDPPFIDNNFIHRIWGNSSFPLETIANGTLWMDSLKKMGPKLGPMLAPLIKETYDDPLRYALFGVDFIPKSDGSFYMLEINSYPAFQIFFVMTDVIIQALQLGEYDLDQKTRLVEIWKLPETIESRDEL